jgi:hypothetical protein
MRDAVHYAVLVSIAAAFPALAQTAAPPAGVTSNGIVTLGTGTSASAAFPATSVAPTAASQATSGTTTGGSATGSAGAAASTSGTPGGAGASGSPSGTPAVTGSTSSSRAGSGGSSGGAATAPSISVPAWVLCPPSGASGIQPFLAGTDLSCAP